MTSCPEFLANEGELGLTSGVEKADLSPREDFPMRFVVLSTMVLSLAAWENAVGAPAFSEDEIAFFTEKVRPILQANCFKCHGGEDADGKPKIRSGLQLISRRGIVKGGTQGPAYDSEHPEDSLILQMVSYKDEEHEMPPGGKLPDADLATLRSWVEMGLPWTPEDAEMLIHVEEEGQKVTEVNELTKSYWSYKPLARPEVPQVSHPEWQMNPIDAFIFSKLQEKGLSPNPPAEARALIRRAYHNITGLPPTPEEMEREVAIFSRSSWRSLIDRLLESPHYGEKWARHWLDIVRYAESNGFERDSVKEFIWRYRDYVIGAFNEDKPYDEFIREQLAGDELDEVTPDSLIATGYHRLMQWDDEPADRLQHVYDVLDDNVRITAEGILGMTLGCARCHDHKGDPIPQKDYYRFMAFFHGVTQMDKKRVIQSIEVSLPKEERERKEQERRQREQELADQILELESKAKVKLVALVPEAELQGTTTAPPTLIPHSKDKSQPWAYTTEQPGEDWYGVGYRPRDWKQGRAPFGRHKKAKTRWVEPEIWLQKTFGLASLPSGLKLTIQHDEDVEVYLNGQLVFEAKGHITDYKHVALSEEVVASLQTGRNVVAVHVKQTTGGQFIDLGLEADFGASQLARLLEEHGAKAFTPAEGRKYRQWHRQLAKVRQEASETDLRAMMVQERSPPAEPMFVHLRGSAHVHGEPVEPGFPQILGGGTPKIPEPRPGAKTTGRRRVLADWIAGKDNPRTARVMVNRLWQHHFGRGICPTSNDFGFLGEEASHPEMLDWLACEFMERGWSLKAMHRLIMSSKTYQMSSRGKGPALTKDPENTWFWRFDMRRLSAEEIRDGMLAVTGSLNPKVGGPSFFPTLPPEVLATSSTGAGKWGKSTPEEEARRSVYITIKRSLKPPELTDFDFADTDSTCAARFVTTVPIQALAMLNSRSVNDHASQLAQRLRREAGDSVRDQVVRGLHLVSLRRPTAEEIHRCLAMIDTFVSEHKLSPADALERFCLLALNLNEFTYLD